VDRENKAAYDYSALVYLGDQGVEFEGGSLVFDDGFVIRPRRGMVAAFSSGGENGHYVARVARGERFVLALWFTCAPPDD